MISQKPRSFRILPANDGYGEPRYIAATQRQTMEKQAIKHAFFYIYRSFGI